MRSSRDETELWSPPDLEIRHAVARHRQSPLVKSEFTGLMISTWSEAWRHECEVAFLLAMPPAKRNPFLDGIQGGTGDDRGIKGPR